MQFYAEPTKSRKGSANMLLNMNNQQIKYNPVIEPQ